MKISLVLAAALDGTIGDSGDLPSWNLPNDMKRFKEITSGHCVLMGRKTYESIPKKFRPLPNRTNLVVTRDLDKVTFQDEDVQIFQGVEDSISAAIDYARNSGEKELMVIGGGEIYTYFLKNNPSLVDTVYLTEVKKAFNGDTKVDTEPLHRHNRWEMVENKEFTKDEKHDCDYAFYTFNKI